MKPACAAWVTFVLEAVLANAHAGTAEERAPAAVSPEFGPPGPAITYAAKPSLARETKACSMRLPLCVHAPPTMPGSTILGVLASAERAWDALSGPLGLHTPDGDLHDLAYPIYIVPRALVPATTQLTARDMRSRIDRARSQSVFDQSAVMAPGCRRDALVTREMARAFMYRQTPATAEAIADAQTAYLAQLIEPCTLAFEGAEDAQAFQSRPDLPICTAEVPETSSQSSFRRGASLFWGRIDWAYARGPGALITASWALAPTMTSPLQTRWNDEPDAFDVLRTSFKGALTTGSSLSDLLVDTAIARAFMGSADDGLHHPETRTQGAAARIRPDWDLPWPKSSRRVAPRTPVAPTGASYLVIHREGAGEARLRVEIAWEEHALFRWAFVKIDATGREIGRVMIPTSDRATEAQMTLIDFDGADRVMLVGANVGDPAYSFDPDDEVFEPHSWLVTIAEEKP